MSLWFVTPAYGRYEMTAICLEQRRRAIAELGKRGIEAHQVVVADDGNLDVARSVGADIVEAANVLGQKWNLGMEYAGRQGAQWIVQIGSDSWIDPAYFNPLTHPRHTLTSTLYCAVTATSLARLNVSPKRLEHSAGPYVFHRSLLEPSAFHPCAIASRMTDTSTIRGIIASGGRLRWRPRNVHPYQYVGFRVPPMMTSYAALTRRWLVVEEEPWSVLARHYPVDLVERARVLMESLP
jgi:hypothetical protein